MEDYAEQHGPTKLVMFEDALEHLTRIHRTLRMEQGHTLLVGLGGGGKQSLTKVIDHANCSFRFYSLNKGKAILSLLFN